MRVREREVKRERQIEKKRERERGCVRREEFEAYARRNCCGVQGADIVKGICVFGYAKLDVARPSMSYG